MECTRVAAHGRVLVAEIRAKPSGIGPGRGDGSSLTRTCDVQEVANARRAFEEAVEVEARRGSCNVM